MSNGDISIRKLGPADLESLQEISISTFNTAFAAENTEENMSKYISDAFSKKSLLSELNNPESMFFFAETADNIIGYLKLNTGTAQSDLKEENALEIARIYVDAAFQGRQVGQKLFDKTLELARNLKVDFIWLGVWERNPGAIRFYERNGFVKYSTHDFMLGDDRQTDIIMKRPLE